MIRIRAVLLLIAALTAGAFASPAAGALDIYWIDVEGGGSTLIVTPQGQSVLMDAGWNTADDRDAARIERVVRTEAKLQQIDYLLTSHFHADHAGGVAALAKRVKINAFLDHGESVERGTSAGAALWQQYLGAVGDRRRVAAAGERLPLAGVDLTIVVSGGQVLAKAPAGASNPLCDTFQPQPEDAGENARSLGYVLSAGAFQFVDLGDISWNVQHQLACPINLIGKVDLFQATHHAVRDDVLPQLMWAMAPAVTVMNNGPAKGAGPVAVETVRRSPGMTDLWSLHRAVGNDAAHNALEPLTANLGGSEGCAGAWIRARVQPDGSFTITNSRNGFTKTYQSK